MKKILIAGVALVTVTVVCANAGTEAGKKEIQIQGSLTTTTNDQNADRDTTLMGQLGLNYFLSPQFSIGVASMISGTLNQPENGDESKMTAVFLMMRADLYLTDGSTSVVPYLGAQGGGVATTYESGSNSQTETSTVVAYGAHAGLKFFASENTSWNVEGDVMQYKPDIGNDGGTEITITEVQALVGFSYYF